MSSYHHLPATAISGSQHLRSAATSTLLVPPPGLQLDNEVSQSTNQSHGTVFHWRYGHRTCRRAPLSGHLLQRYCSRSSGAIETSSWFWRRIWISRLTDLRTYTYCNWRLWSQSYYLCLKRREMTERTPKAVKWYCLPGLRLASASPYCAFDTPFFIIGADSNYTLRFSITATQHKSVPSEDIT